MLYSLQKRSLVYRFKAASAVGLLVFVVLLLVPGHSMAQAFTGQSCNPKLNFTITTPPPWFEGDTMRVSANLGAGDIGGNAPANEKWMRIDTFGFALNCNANQDFQTCTSAGHTVEFIDIVSTNCKNSNGEPANILHPESNVIPFKSAVYPIQTGPNETCNLQFDIRVDELNGATNRVRQSMGWPLDGEPAAVCSNGGTTTGTANIAFNMSTCDIDLNKQVSVNGEDWFDADSAETAPELLLGGNAHYRLIVTNTGTADFVQPISVVDAALGINTTIPALAQGASVILDEDDIANLTAEGHCQIVDTLQNTASVQGICRAGDAPVNASAQDSAYLVCTGAASIGIEKATNGQDADNPTGPSIAVGAPVTWTYAVTNNGQLPLSNVVVSDSDFGAVVCPKNSLAIGESMNCSANGTAVAGQYANTGSVTADFAGGLVNDSDDSHYFGVAAAIDIVKTASPQTYVTAGVNIGYTFVVTNTGNVTLTAVTVTDPLPNLGAITCNWAGSSDGATPAGTLSPGEIVSCAASYTTTTADVSAGKVDNTATATGTPPTGPNVSDTDSETITSTAAPDIDIRKEIWNGTSFVDANDAASAPVVHWPAGAIYRIIVKNTGAVALDGVVINDPALGITNYAPIGVGGAGKLAIDEEVIVTSAQVPELEHQSRCTSSDDYENIASASGDSEATGEEVNDTDSAWLTCVGTPNLAVKKEISIDGGDTWIDGTAGPVEFPSGALYRITVENTGSVKLVNVTVSDTLIGPPNHVIGDLAIGEIVVVADGVIEVGDSAWSALDVAEVCDSSALIENIASATGTSDELASDEVTRTDNAKLDCIGPPMIAVKKEVSLDNGNSWDDANEEPFPTAVTDPLNPVTALYRITVTNIGDVALTGVLVSDTTLGIVDYVPIGNGGPGVLGVGESVEIDSGDLPVMTVQNRCATTGEKANVAAAEGYSAAGTKDEATDSATVECIGEAAIRITKEVSSDGVNFEDVSVSAIAPSDAWYRITVENIGTVDLENVVISDSILGLTDVVVTGAGGAGLLAVGEVVVISHSGGGGDNELAELYVPELCLEADSYVNTAIADGKSVESVQTVDDSDSATFICEERIDICDTGRPNRLKMMYDGDDDSNNEQGAAFVANPQSVTFPATPITIKTFNSQDLTTPLDVFENKSVGSLFYVEDPNKSGKIPPNIVIEFWDGSTLLQTIRFHGSCSAPLFVGDEYSAATLVGAIYF
ncbi:MAG: DUF7507 domain-containing protein [Lysobacterales bacterium]